MTRKKTAVGALVVLICLLAETLVAVSSWQQVGSDGFGDPLAEEVSAVAAFDGYLYAGTSNPTNDARIFRSADGMTWNPVIEPGFGSAHDTAPPAILDMAVFNGRLFASTGRGNAAQIWYTINGISWGQVVNAGFGDPNITDISVLTEYNGLLYAGATSAVAGAQIWRSYTGDSNSWTKVAPAVAGTGADLITGMAVFDGALYAAVQFEAETPVAIWRTNGGAWTTIVSDGFGDSSTITAGDIAVYGNYLYVGAGSNTTGAQLWRTADGSVWEHVVTPIPGFGDANNRAVTTVTVFQDTLYLSVDNAASGLEIWQSTNGTTWVQDNADGFGDINNTATNGSNATAVFLNQLYLGMANMTTGGELWRRPPPYGVNLAADAALTGVPGQTLTYTLSVTNTGTTTDTFSLATAGHTWVTTLSTPSMTLNPGASGAFTVTVTIPLEALYNTVDAATVTSTSQGNSAVKDSAVLTTMCVYQVYLPLILRFP